MRFVVVLGMSAFAYVLPGCESDSGESLGTDGGVDGGTDGGTCDEACGSPSDFAGTWTGTFQCTYRTSDCGTFFGDDIELEVMQDGCSATYSDGFATFAGDVCGDAFTFHLTEGGDPGSTETGTLTLTAPNEAHKESTFVSADGCTGDCLDDLSRSTP